MTARRIDLALLLPVLLCEPLGCSGSDGTSGPTATETSSSGSTDGTSSTGPSSTTQSSDGTTEETTAGSSSGTTDTSDSETTDPTTGPTTGPDTDATSESETGATDTESSDTDGTDTATDTEATDTDETDTGLDGPPVLDVGVGGSHVCAANEDGLVYCWGSNSLSALALPNSEDERLTPHWVDAVDGVVQVALGAGFTLARTGDGQVYCWGRGAMCSGDKQAPNAVEPVLMDLNDIQDIDAARINACALNSSGELLCWGENGNGQVSDSSFVESPTPVDGISPVAKMSVGLGHRCIYLEAGGVFCWGYGQAGRLGTGNEGDQADPAAVSGLAQNTELEVVAAGGTASCASIAGEGLCWGGGQVGKGEFTPASVPGLADARAIAIGWSSACTLLGDGHELRCWGDNQSGTLGTGDEEASPELVTPVGLASADTVDVAGRTSCAIDGGELYCWGQNLEGMVGDGTKVNRLMPTQVILP